MNYIKIEVIHNEYQSSECKKKLNLYLAIQFLQVSTGELPAKKIPRPCCLGIFSPSAKYEKDALVTKTRNRQL